MSRAFLECDSSILEDNLLLPEFRRDEDLPSLFPVNRKNEKPVESKPVRPTPGFCAKCRTTEGDKIFINVCQTEEVPVPKDLSDDELVQILESDDAPNYKIPMSIGNLHVEADKSGNMCSVYDIAINPSFFNKICTNELFKTFFMTVVMEALKEKYSIELDFKGSNAYVILKNRKVIGKLQVHNIRQKSVNKPSRPLIEELPTDNRTVSSTQTSQATTSSKNIQNLKSQVPYARGPPSNQTLQNPNSSYKLVIEKCPAGNNPEYLLATLLTNSILEDLTLDVGEDRMVVVNSKKNQVISDVFLPYNIDQDRTQAIFHSSSQVLKVKMPLLKNSEKQ